MVRIAISKVRTAHDVSLSVGRMGRGLLGMLGAKSVVAHLGAMQGKPALPQSALPYLGALVERYNQRNGTDHEFALFDEHEERLEQLIHQQGPFDMVWFTGGTHVAPPTYRLAQRLAKAGIPTVMGGIHATVCTEEAAQYVTSVARGEGENTVDEIIDDHTSGRGLKPVYNGHRAGSLEGMPVPAWKAYGFPPIIISVQTSRGCRNACSFCSTTRFQGTARRHRPVEEIVNELKTYRDQGLLQHGNIFFTDNNIVSDTDHRRGVIDTAYARKLFEALLPLGVRWSGQGEINLANDPELVALAAASGCHTLLVGFETLDQSNLGDINKPSNTVENYARQIDTLHAHGISLIGCFIFGLDHDTPAVFDSTFDFIDRYIDTPQLTIMTPYPGTALHKRLQKEGRLLHQDWQHYDILHAAYRPARMTVQELESGYQRLNRRVYSMANIIKRSTRYALAKRVPAVVNEPFINRFCTVFGTNLYYRSLARQVIDATARERAQALQPIEQPAGQSPGRVAPAA